MIASFKRIKAHMRLFDHAGLSADQIRTLHVFIVAIMGGAVWGNITTGVAFTGYIKTLGASDSLYGLVIVLPCLTNAFQFLVSYWMERTRKRARLFIISGLIQRLCWLPIALVPVFIPAAQVQLRLWSVVVLATVSALMGPAMNVSFFSVFNDVVPMNIRGRYMATRSRLSTMVSLTMGLLVGVLLDRLPPMVNYTAVFSIATVFGAFDICCFLTTKLPEMPETQAPENMFKMLRSVLGDKKYMHMVMALTCWFFTIQLCAPYFSVFALKPDGIGLNYLQVLLSGTIIYNIMVVVVVSRWGRSMDAYGNKPVLVISAALTSFVPLIWVRMGQGMFWFVVLSNALSGLSYCAVDLSSTNLFMVQAPARNRSMYFAIYFLFTQLFGLTLGSLTGGLLLDNVFSHIDQMGLSIRGVPFTRYNALFALSFVLRIAAALLLLTTIKDSAPRHTIELVRAILRSPAHAWRGLCYGIKRRHLRKQYDAELAELAEAGAEAETEAEQK